MKKAQHSALEAALGDMRVAVFKLHLAAEMTGTGSQIYRETLDECERASLAYDAAKAAELMQQEFQQ